MDEPSYLKLEPGEKVMLTRRRHVVNLLPFALGGILALLGIMFFSTFAVVHRGDLPAQLPLATVSLLLVVLMGLVVGTFVLAIFVFWQNRIILTNIHYIQIDQIGLFNRSVNKLHLDQIQDVRGTRKGIFATLLNFGEIEVETAGEHPNFVFKPIADPLNTAEFINECRAKHRNRAQV